VRLSALAIVGCVASTALLLSAQSPPVRDALPGQSNPRTDTGLVRGRIVADGADIPIRKARVTLTPDAGGHIDPAYSDIEGRFEFSSVPRGRYTVAAWKTGYVETKFGAKSFWDRPVPVSVTAGAAVDDLQIGLARGAAISGRIVDAFNDPLFGRTVTVGRVAAANGRPRFEQTGSARTDDLGEYRIGGLPAGAFVVAVTGLSGSAPIELARAQAADSRADMMVRTAADRFQSLFYPQSPLLAQAQPIVLRPGEDSSGVDITFIASTVRVPRVSGRIVDPAGRSTSFSFSAGSDGAGVGAAAMGMMMSIPQTGEFAIALQPGDYTLFAQGDGGTAMRRVNVDQADIEGLQLVLSKGARVSGRVLFDGASSRPPGRLSVQAVPRELAEGTGPINVNLLVPPVPVTPAGTFTLSNVIGACELRVTNPPNGWVVKSMTSGGRSLLDVPIDFKNGEDLRDVVVVLSERLGELNGTVTDSRNAPAFGASVVVFAEDRQQLARRAYWVRPDHLGRFVVPNLAAGNYLVALVEQVDDRRWPRVDYLDRLREHAMRVTLADLEKKTIDLRWNGSR
jgi:hypothetical protein